MCYALSISALMDSGDIFDGRFSKYLLINLVSIRGYCYIYYCYYDCFFGGLEPRLEEKKLVLST